MLVKTIIDEDFNNYRKPSMLIATCYCDWKCCTENGFGIDLCQNSDLSKQKIIDIPVDEIFSRYINNPITSSIVIGGLEPFLQFQEIYELIKYLREHNCLDDVCIYTGYYPEETQNELNRLKQFPNIIVKFGRYVPSQQPHYDEILGVMLASDNQYAERIS